MKSTSHPKAKSDISIALKPEYRFDYTKAKPNRFACRVVSGSVAGLLDPDVASFFQNAHPLLTIYGTGQPLSKK